MNGERQVTMRMILLLVLAAFLASESTILRVSGRYLPTRSQDDKIERLRELLKDLLESQSLNTRQSQQELNYDGGEGSLGSGGSSLGSLGSGGIGSSGRTILFKRDIGGQGSHSVRNAGQEPLFQGSI